jgi:serine/threonine protein kinase
VLNRLSHPLIVPLYATFQDYGTLYFQLELLEGGELWSQLHHTLEEGSRAPVGLPLSMATFFFAEILTAVEYLHRCGIVHRDLKPENVLLGKDGVLAMPLSSSLLALISQYFMTIC